MPTDIFTEHSEEDSPSDAQSATSSQTASPNNSPNAAQVATTPTKSNTVATTGPDSTTAATSPPKDATIGTAPPDESGTSQSLTPIVSATPGDVNVKNNTHSSPVQSGTLVTSLVNSTVTGENVANKPLIQSAPKQPSPTQGDQVALTTKPDSADTIRSESSGTTESGKPMTRQRTHVKGKELKKVTEAEDPEAKARKMKALARQKKEKERAKSGTSSSNSPAKTVTFEQGTSVTTPVRSPDTKTSSSTPSDLSKSDSSDQMNQVYAGLIEEGDGISRLFPIDTPEGLEKMNDVLDGFLGDPNKAKKKKVPTEAKKESMEEHIASVAKQAKHQAKAHSSPEQANMKKPFENVAKPVRTIERISPNSEGGMSLKSVQEFETEEARAKMLADLEAEGINPDTWNVFMPDETEMDEEPEASGIKTTGMSEFAKDAYASATVTDPEQDISKPTVSTAEAELIAAHDLDELEAGNTFADDADQTPHVRGSGEWKTPKVRDRKPGGICSLLSPHNWRKGQNSDSGSDSTVVPGSPNHNPYSPLSDDKEDDSENPVLPPITDIESAMPGNDQLVTEETSNDVNTGDQGDLESQDFHQAESE